MSTRKIWVGWTSVAERDLADIAIYLQRDSPAAARELLLRIRERASSLTTVPNRGRVVPELLRLEIRTYRELIVSPHRLIYSLRGDRVSVLAVLDSRRDLEDLLLRRLLFEGEDP